MLEFTGERYIPTEDGEIRYEHMHRYSWVQTLCARRTVLDVACGEGYGSAMLANVAKSVVGVDLSHEAIAHASKKYATLENLRFLQGSATSIQMDDASVDIVVSFETIEHLEPQAKMLAELRRVLKPDGLLIISSPNKRVYSDDRGYTNEHHVKELYFDDFDALLKQYFAAKTYLGQRFVTASVLLPLHDLCDSYDALFLDGDRVRLQTFSSNQNMYFVAVCAADAKFLPVVRPNVFFEGGSDLYLAQQKVLRWASGLYDEHKEVSLRLTNLQAEFDERSNWALSLREQCEILQQQRNVSEIEFISLRNELIHAKGKLSAIEASRSWKLLESIRRLVRSLP